MLEQLGASEQMVCGRSEGILVRSAVQVVPHELFWRCIVDSPNRHVCGSQTANLVVSPSDSEVGEQDSSSA